jgi:hypothetical protein
MVGVEIARGCHQDHPGRHGGVDRLAHRPRVAGVGERHVHHPSAGDDGLVDAQGDVGVPAAAVVVEHLDRPHLGVPTDARDALGVIGGGGHDPRHVGAVPVAVIGERTVAEVAPDDDLARQVGVRGVHAGVEDGDDHVGAALREVPRHRSTHPRQAPLVDAVALVGRRRCEARVVGHRRQPDLAVDLGPFDAGVGFQPTEGAGRRSQAPRAGQNAPIHSATGRGGHGHRLG